MSHHEVVRYFANLLFDNTYRNRSLSVKKAAISKPTADDTTSGTLYLFENDPEYKAAAKEIAALGFSAENLRTLIAEKLQKAIDTIPAPVDSAIGKLVDAKEPMDIIKLGMAPVIPVNPANKELITTVKTNYVDIERVRELIVKQKADPNFRDSDGKPLCVIAAELGNHQILKELIKANADLEAKDAQGKTAIIAVLSQCMVQGSYSYKRPGCLLAIKALLDAGVSPNFEYSFQTSGKPCTPLQLANAMNDIELANLLFEYGVDPRPLLQSVATDKEETLIVKTAKLFLNATKARRGCDEWENHAIVHQLSQERPLTQLYAKLKVRANFPDGDSRIKPYPIHMAGYDEKQDRGDAIDLHELKMPDGRSCHEFIHSLLEKIDTTSPVPLRVKAHASTVALPGEFLQDEKNDAHSLAAAEFVVECTNDSNEKRPYLTIVWPTNATSMKDVRVDYLHLNPSSGLGCIGGKNAAFIPSTNSAAETKSDTKALKAIEVPNEVVDAPLAKVLSENGTHTVFIRLKPKPAPKMVYNPYSYGYTLGVPKGLSTRGASQTRGGYDGGSTGFIGAVTAGGPPTMALCALSVAEPSKGYSGFAVVDNGSHAVDNRSSSSLGYTPVIDEITYHRTGALVVNTGRLTTEEKQKYNRDAAAERFKTLMIARSQVNLQSMPFRKKYSLAVANEILTKLPYYQHDLLMGEDARFVKEYNNSETYPSMFYVTLKTPVHIAKQIVSDINRRAGVPLATYDKHTSNYDEQTVYLDSMALVECVSKASLKYAAYLAEHNRILNEALKTKDAPLVEKADLAELTFLRVHGIQDISVSATTDIGKGDFFGKITINLGIPYSSAERLVAAINKNRINSAKLHRTSDLNQQLIVVDPDYLLSETYLASFKQTFSSVFANAVNEERAFIDNQLVRAGVLDHTLKQCMDSLVDAVGISAASQSFTECMRALARELSPASIPDWKKIPIMAVAARAELKAYRDSRAVLFATPNANAPALPLALTSALAKTVTPTEDAKKLQAVEDALATIEKHPSIVLRRG